MKTHIPMASMLIPFLVWSFLVCQIHAAVRKVPPGGGPFGGRRRTTTAAPKVIEAPQGPPVTTTSGQTIRRRIPILPPAERWDKIARQQGPHTCPREEVVDDPEIHYHRAWTGGSVCGRRTAVKVDCCFGYGRMAGATGCPLVKPLTTLMETAKQAGAKEFVELGEITGLTSALASANHQALTLLAPTDRGMKQVPADILESLKGNGPRNLTNYREGPPTLLFHMIAGRVDLKTLPSNSLIPSLFADQPIRFNVFPNGLVTADCVPISQGSLESLEGVVHTLQSPLHPLLNKGDQVGDFSHVPARMTSLMDTLARHTKLRRFSAVLSHAQRTSASPLLSHSQLHFRQATTPVAVKPITLLAPSNEAFDELPVDFLQSVLYNQEALTAFISNHIIDGILCSAMVGAGGGQGPARPVNPPPNIRGQRKPPHMLKTAVGNIFRATCEPGKTSVATNISDLNDLDSSTTDNTTSSIDNTNETEEKVHSDAKMQGPHEKTRSPDMYKIGEAVIIKSDIMALDGVIHIIDRVLVPKKARSLSQIASDLGLTILLSLLPNTGLQSALVGRGSLTLFAPSDKAFKALPNGTLDYYYNNPQEARILLLGHMTSGRYPSSSLVDNQLIHTRYPGKNLRAHVFRGGKMVGNGKLINYDVEGSNGILHVVDQVLMPAEESITDYLRNKGNFTRFLDALSKTSPSLLELLDPTKLDADGKSSGLKDHQFTVFAVADEDMNWNLDYSDPTQDDYALPNQAAIDYVMRHHVIPGVAWTKLIEPNGFYPLQGLDTEHDPESRAVPVMMRRTPDGKVVTAGNSIIIGEEGENGMQQSNIHCTNGVVHRLNGLVHVPNPY